MLVRKLSRDPIIMYDKQREKKLKRPYLFLAVPFRPCQVYHLKALKILLLVVPSEPANSIPQKEWGDAKVRFPMLK